MTIKEVEKELDIPRATVRFYEKEGLLRPQRGENGYRAYSRQDIEDLKKIIIFRKLGFSLTDVEDVLDGAKPLSEVIESNISQLELQMKELEGALKLSRKLKESKEEMETFFHLSAWKEHPKIAKNQNTIHLVVMLILLIVSVVVLAII